MAKIKQHKIVSIVSLVIVLVSGFMTYQAIAKYETKKAFEDARVAIDTIYSDIVAKVGQPDNFKRTNTCSRPSRDFEQGPLSCSVGTDFIYGVDDQAQANIVLKKIQAVIATHPDLLKPTKPLSSSITDTLVVNTTYHDARDDYLSNKKMECSAKYTYDTAREIDLSILDLTKKPLQISIDCDDFAAKAYYPIH